MRPIDADALKKEIGDLYGLSFEKMAEMFTWLKVIDKAPTIEPEKTKESELVEAYTKGFDAGVATVKPQGEERSCKTCKYYLYGFEGHPCMNCCRNPKLVDEIREQKNDLWKDGTPNG